MNHRSRLSVFARGAGRVATATGLTTTGLTSPGPVVGGPVVGGPVVGALTVAGLLVAGLAMPAHAARPNRPAVEHDFSRLSRDGLRAFVDIDMARQALAQGDKATAGRILADANQALDHAQGDHHRFVRAEAALTPAAKAPPGAPGHLPAPTAGTQDVTWIPVDGEYVVSNAPAATPDKVQAVQSANRSLKKGDTATTSQALTGADIDVDFIIAVAPLQPVTADVYRASNLAATDPKAADQALANAQDALRFIVDDMVFAPRTAGKTGPAGTAATTAPTTPANHS
jgi:YfdX protein